MGDDDDTQKKKGNALETWGNAQTMNINNLIVTNILSSPYFKNQLFKLKTFHEVVDEIYYKVDHLEPWEKGSRKTHGQVGMCGGVRGVGAGGIVSSGYCLLFKLFTLKLTEKQLVGLLDHTDSPYIRGLGFMYIRYCIPPSTFWDWFEPYLEDDEQIDPKAGSGCPMTIGQMVRSFLLKLDWYGTLFPRIPVPIHKEIEANLKEYNLCDDRKIYANDDNTENNLGTPTKEPMEAEASFGEAERYARRKREEADRSPRKHGSNQEEERNHRRSSHRGDSRSKDGDRNSSSHRHRDDKQRRSHSRDRKESRRSDRSHKKSSRDRSRERHDKHRERSREHERSHEKSKSSDKRSSSERKRSHSRERYK